MSRGNRYRRSPTQPERGKLSANQLVSRLILLLAIVGLVVIAVTLFARNLTRRGTPTQLDIPGLAINPQLTPIEAATLNAYLVFNRADLESAAGGNPTAIMFVVEAGQTASEIASNLRAANLIIDETLFVRYVRYYGLDLQLEAGTFQLTQTQSIPQIAAALTNAIANEIEIRITEGWRREQTAAYLEQQTTLPFSGADFLALTAPGAFPDNPVAADLPPGAALEGFLFPDTYRLSPDASARDFVTLMLNTFNERVDAQLRADAISKGLTMYQVLTLASIVEREAVVPDERPLIASVFLNRLAIDMKLEADPTVQYAMGYQAERGEWWNLNLTGNDLTGVISPYNTYLNAGLPPGPIASPGFDSIQAVIRPEITAFLFFRAACDGSGRHNFATTFEEHVANGC